MDVPVGVPCFDALNECLLRPRCLREGASHTCFAKRQTAPDVSRSGWLRQARGFGYPKDEAGHVAFGLDSPRYEPSDVAVNKSRRKF